MPNQDYPTSASSSDDSPQSSAHPRVGDTASPSKPDSTEPERPRPTGASTAVEGVADLARRIYDGTFTRKRLNKADILAIKMDSGIPSHALEELLDIASEDAALASTYRLMAILAGRDGPRFTDAREFARQALTRHPAFRHPDLASTLNNHADAPRPEIAVECLASQDFYLLVPEQERESRKASAARQTRDTRENAIRCLLLWLHARHKISLDRVRHLLHHHVWSTYAQRHKAPEDQLCALLAAKQTGAVVASIASDLFETKVTQQSYRTDAAQRAEDRAKASAQRLQREVEKLQRDLDASLQQRSVVDQELASERVAHADERAHLQSDHERLRGTVLRHLKGDLTLMEDGLHALQRDPPRVHVMVDHADRVIDSMRRTINSLRET